MPDINMPLPSLLTGPELPPGGPRDLGAALDSTIAAAPEATLTTLDKSGSARTIGYRDLRSRARARWSDLRSKGLASGRTALLVSEDPGELLECAWACFVGGAPAALVAAPIDFRNDLSGLKRLRDAVAVLPDAIVVLPPGLGAHWSEVEEIVGKGRLMEPLSALPPGAGSGLVPDPHETATALLLLTSGSTGLPKVVPLSHRQIILRSVAAAMAMDDPAGGIALNWMPLDHVGGIVMFHLGPLISGCSQVQVPTRHVLAEPTRWIDLVDRHRASLTWAPNFAFGLVAERLRRTGGERGWDLSCVRGVINGGEPVNPATARRFLQSLAPYRLDPSVMRPMWGMSETASGCILARGVRDDLVAGSTSVGKPIPGLSMRLVDDSDRTVPCGTVGVLQVKGPYVVDGYEVSDEAARAAFVADGWFSSGDEGLVCEGELVLVGRASETIIVNGVNHHAPALEMAVEQLDWIRPGHTAVCAARPSGADTDEVVVFACIRDGVGPEAASVEEISALLVRQFGISPSDVVLIDEAQFPRTGLGKIQRKLLARRYEEDGFDGRRARQDDGIVSPLLVPRWRQSARTEFARSGFRLGSVRSEPGEAKDLRRIGEALAAQAALSTGAVEGGPVLHLLVLAADRSSGEPLDSVLAGDSAWVSELGGSGEEVRFGLVVAGGAEPWRALPAVAARIAYLRNAASELPRLKVGIVFVDDLTDEVAEHILAELADPAGEEVAFAGGVRLAKRLEPLDRSERAEGPGWVRGGHYVITGCGDVGRALAGFLVDALDARVTLLARRAPSADAVPAGCASLVADVLSRDQMRSALRAASAERPVTAVLHLAGRMKEWPIAKMTKAVLTEVLEPKVDGGEILIQVMRETVPGTPLILFSSLLATFHAPLYGPYVAANRYLEALAEGHAPAVCAVAWGSWAGLGMSRDMPHGRHALSVGFGTLPLDQAVEGLRLAISSGEPVVLVGANPSGTRVRPLLGAIEEPFDRNSGAQVRLQGTARAGPKPPGSAESALLDEQERRLAAPIGEIWCDILNIESVGLDDNFFAVGGDSLAVAELHARLCDLTGTELPMVPLFMAANLRDMIRFAADPRSQAEGDGDDERSKS